MSTAQGSKGKEVCPVDILGEEAAVEASPLVHHILDNEGLPDINLTKKAREYVFNEGYVNVFSLLTPEGEEGRSARRNKTDRGKTFFSSS